jgi:hypothetical protein
MPYEDSGLIVGLKLGFNDYMAPHTRSERAVELPERARARKTPNAQLR